MTALERQMAADAVALSKEHADRADAAEARAEAAEARLAELESAVAWHTSCTSCAAVRDAAYAETMRREAAEAKLATVVAYCQGRADAEGRVHIAGILATIGTGEEDRG